MRRARVLLVRHALTAATREGRFPADEDLDPSGREQATALGTNLPPAAALTSPARRAATTARLAGFSDATIEPALAECRFGRWSRRSLSDVERDEPVALARWLADPRAAPTAGESMAEVTARMTELLQRLHGEGETTVCFTHGGPIRVAIVHTLDAPLEAAWRLDVAPCSVSELHARPDGKWTLTAFNVVRVKR